MLDASLVEISRVSLNSDSERNDECIDFTMMCVFFFSFLCLSLAFGAVKLLIISFNSIFFDGKVNLVGILDRIGLKIFMLVFNIL